MFRRENFAPNERLSAGRHSDDSLADDMIDAIFAQLSAADAYDFRRFASPRDPSAHLFPEWVDYYRLKFAIAKTLQPKTIIEIGVRFGYSARTMLEAAPQAVFTGIDLDSNAFGGVEGALSWARGITSEYEANFILVNSQNLSRLPGRDIYDLAHIDGQQDGDGTIHDLSLAFRQCRFVLLDGWFWSAENASAGAEALRRYRRAIEYSIVIPGYAGELLVKVAPEYLAEMATIDWSGDRSGRASSSGALRTIYTRSYFLGDCGGYEAFKRSAGKELEDTRLATVATLASSAPPGPVLDLGCGRGELTYHFAFDGRQVTAIDYSDDAIRLAESVLSSDTDLRARVRLVCSDVNSVRFDTKYALAVAVDLVEHLAPHELDCLYARVAAVLQADGIFIVHTAPNLWRYRFDYARRRRVAKSVGAYMPRQPRSEYELLMHINEQAPNILRAQLRKYFPRVAVWCGTSDDPGGTLLDPALSKFRAYDSIYAVASGLDFTDESLRSKFVMNPLGEDAMDLSISINCDATIVRGCDARIPVTVTNRSNADWRSRPPFPVYLSYHWIDADAGNHSEFGGLRTPFLLPLGPGQQRAMTMLVRAPLVPGRYKLRATLVQEYVRWFDQLGSTHYIDRDVEVR